MFNSKKQSYTRKTKTTTTNSYGEKVETYTAASNILMFISLSSEEEIGSNDVRITQCTHIGLTKDSVSVGDLIADKYIIWFINKGGAENIVYMKELESDGNYNR